jgi:hypothetical protein
MSILSEARFSGVFDALAVVGQLNIGGEYWPLGRVERKILPAFIEIGTMTHRAGEIWRAFIL